MNVPASLLDGPAGVTVHAFSLLAAAEELDEYRGLLDTGERERATRFAFERDARRFIVGRAALRILLSATLGPPARKLTFGVEPGTTKPRLTGPHQVAFNLSNSADRALLAIAEPAAYSAVGIDLERVAPLADLERVAARFFSARERRDLAATGNLTARTAAFYACWTRKEAVLKGVGNGLTLPLADFDVDLYASGPFEVHGRGDTGRRVAGWVVHPLLAGPGWAAALATPSGRPRAAES